MNAKELFDIAARNKVIAAIKEAELNTSGEIRLHVEDRCKEDVMDHATFIFEKLEMHKTELRNGVLFYIALEDRKFAILGDAGINKVVANDFWEQTRDLVFSYLKKGDIIAGLSEGIKLAGVQLKEHFPYQSNDINELSDEISFGN